MIGLNKFKEYFRKYEQQYVLIGVEYEQWKI